jgi:hypothetical protein
MGLTSLLLLFVAIALLVFLRTLWRKRDPRSRSDATARGDHPTLPEDETPHAKAAAVASSEQSGTASPAATEALSATLIPHDDAARYQQRFHEAARLIAHGDFDRGFTVAIEVFDFARTTGHHALSGAALSLIADVHRHHGDLAVAEASTAESLRDTRQANPPLGARDFGSVGCRKRVS